MQFSHHMGDVCADQTCSSQQLCAALVCLNLAFPNQVDHNLHKEERWCLAEINRGPIILRQAGEISEGSAI